MRICAAKIQFAGVQWICYLCRPFSNQHGKIHAALKSRTMKKGIHPDQYRLVVFKDMSNGHAFLTRSTAPSKETVKWEDGNEYPLIKMEISNTSHPFFTGQNILVDTAGRIDKFKKKYAKK
jgi:large subunit ribosomal protein L31